MTARSSLQPAQRKSSRRNSAELTPITDEEIFGAAGMNGSQIGFLRNIPPEKAAARNLPAWDTAAVANDAVGSDSVPTDSILADALPTEAISDNKKGTEALIRDHVGTENVPIASQPSETHAAGSICTEAVPIVSVLTQAVPTKSVSLQLEPTVPVPTAVLCGPHPSQRRTPIACATVHDGHSRSEHVAYELLWKAAGKWGRRESDESRLLRFKQPWLATILGIHENSARSILKSLTRKLAIEETSKPGPAQGREIRVYGPAALLERRRARGLVWAIRSHGVQLLTYGQICQMNSPDSSVGTDIVGMETLEDILEDTIL